MGKPRQNWRGFLFYHPQVKFQKTNSKKQIRSKPQNSKFKRALRKSGLKFRICIL